MNIETSIIAQHDRLLFHRYGPTRRRLVDAGSGIKTQHQRKKRIARNNKLNGFFDAIKHNR